MSTREEIIRLGDELIRDKGYNAFSFSDISRRMGIKNASVHYYFPTKKDLAIGVVRLHIGMLDQLMNSVAEKDPMARLKGFFTIYSVTRSENRVCIVGSLATDLHSVEKPIRKELTILVEKIIGWVTEILAEGKEKNIFIFEPPARTKALMVITNMLAALQLTRITGEKDFNTIKDTLIKEIKA